MKRYDLVSSDNCNGYPPYRRLLADEALGDGFEENCSTHIVGALLGLDLVALKIFIIYIFIFGDGQIGQFRCIRATYYLFCHGIFLFAWKCILWMREHWRKIAEKMYILDLEGNQRGFRVTEKFLQSKPQLPSL